MAAADLESAAPAKATLPECQGPQHQLEEPTSRKVGCTTTKQVKVATMWLSLYPCAQPSTPPTELRNTEYVVRVCIASFLLNALLTRETLHWCRAVLSFFSPIFMNHSLPFTFATYFVDQM